MATKKVAAKKPTTKKKVVKAEQASNVYNTNVPILLAMAVEALILFLGYMIIINAA